MDFSLDRIIIKDLNVRTILGVDYWGRVKKQSVTVNLALYKDVRQAGQTDSLPFSINYSTVCKEVTAFAEKTSHESAEALAEGIAKICIKDCNAPKVTVRVEKLQALLHAALAGVEITRSAEDYVSLASNSDALPVSIHSSHDIVFVKDLRLSTIIGVRPWEREEKQVVVLNLTIYPQFRVTSLQNDVTTNPYDYQMAVRKISQHVGESKYLTIEACTTAVAHIALTECHVNKITVRVEKPNAITFASSAGVEITRSTFSLDDKMRRLALPYLNRARFALKKRVDGESACVDDVKEDDHIVFLALGSNMGDSIANIKKSLQLLEKNNNCKVLDTSYLYDTSPMYNVDQPRFVNAACKVTTSLSAEGLLEWLKAIERDMGRSSIDLARNGPRVIDLDILFYDNIEYTSETLTIPHPRISEREFVLRPLNDIARDIEHPILFRTCNQLLSQLVGSPGYEANEHNVRKFMPIRSSKWFWGKKTFIMGVINVTPDSFSDGGLFNTVEAAVAHAEKLVLDGADIIDIGGYSTRPNADEVDVDREMKRVIPVIRAIREKGHKDMIISIDTFRATVAEAAIAAGADIINDISGGTMDPRMYDVMARMDVPVCIQHTRGTPKTMSELTQYDDVIDDICYELCERVERAIRAGVKRWNIIIDPGIGFAKNAQQNLEILRRLRDMIGEDCPFEGFPCLVGPSRKAFIGAITQKPEAKMRVMGTAAACTACISGGADLLRVHDVKEMVDVVKVSDNIWRYK